MAKTKRKPAYDMSNPRDVRITEAAKAVGLSTKHRLPKGQEDAILSLTPQQQSSLKDSGFTFMQTREGADSDKAAKTVVTRCTLPKCLWPLPVALRGAVEEFSHIYGATIPPETVHLSERTGGGAAKADPYDHDAFARYAPIKRDVGNKAAGVLEWAVRLDSDALISTARWEQILWAGGRLQSVLK